MDRLDWIAACAHQLQRRWRTVDPEQLEEVAADLWVDPALRTLSPIRAAAEWLEPVAPNGILARLGVEDLARGMRGLPQPGEGQPARLQAVVDADGLGRVRISYQLMSSRHHKSRHWFWCACHAEFVAYSSQQPAGLGRPASGSRR
jgi:hypothetical protein